MERLQTDVAEQTAVVPARFSRLSLLGRGALSAVGLAKLGLDVAVLLNFAEAAGFVTEAQGLYTELSRIPEVDLGNVADLLHDRPAELTIIGDSTAHGDGDGQRGVAPGAVFADTTNRLLLAAHLPLPRSGSSTREPFIRGHNSAIGGQTIAQTRERVQKFAVAAEHWLPSTQPQLFVLSTGGNDAIQFAQSHGSVTGVNNVIEVFRNDFLPKFEAEYLKLLYDIAEVRTRPSMQGMRHVYVMGLPDIGKSSELGILRIPGMPLVASAASIHLNHAIYLATVTARGETGINFQYIDTFIDADHQPIGVKLIHYEPGADVQLGHKLLASTIGQLPDGSHDNFLHEARRYEIIK